MSCYWLSYIYIFELAIGWSSKILGIISFCLETKKREKKNAFIKSASH